jgi:hypothetical protein
MIAFNYSTRGKTCFGRWYPRPDRISIFLNKISEAVDPETDFYGFISFICAVEFHELGHIYGFRGGCSKPSDCRAGKCFWCNYIERMFINIYSGFLIDNPDL